MDDNPMAEARLLSLLFANACLYAPFFFALKFKFSLVHPLILPGLFGLAKSFAKQPLDLISKLFAVPEISLNKLGVSFLTDLSVANDIVMSNLINGGSLIVVYATFFGLKKLAVPKLRFTQPRLLVPKVVLIACIGAGFGMYVIQQFGGIEASIYAMGFGRFKQKLLIGGSHWIVASTLLTYACYIWFAYKGSAKLNPLFYGLFFLSLAISFIQTGSRSGIILQGAVLAFIYCIQIRKIPYKLFAAGVIGGILAVGTLGAIRNSAWSNDEVNWEVVTSTSIAEKLELVSTEVASRPNGTAMVYGNALEQVGLLWGRSYLGTLFFFVPRKVWPDKPRSAGAYVNTLLYQKKPFLGNEGGGNGQSIPLSWQAEAYWNFHYLGVLLAAILLGVVYRFWYNMLYVYRSVPIIWIIYILVVLRFSPNSLGMVELIQNLVVLSLIALGLGIWKLRFLQIKG